MSESMRPTRPLLTLLPWFLALAAGSGGLWLFSRSAMSPEAVAEAFGAKPVPARETSMLEVKAYLTEFPEAYLLSPPNPGHLPCPEGLATVGREFADEVGSALEGSNAIADLGKLHGRYADGGWLPGLALAQKLAIAGKGAEAEQVLRELERRKAWPPVKKPREFTLANIHGAFLDAYLRLDRNTQGTAVWPQLKRPIGFARDVANLDQGYVTKLPSWFEHSLPGPGCPPGDATLSTYDLYNNLIVGYLRRSYRGTPEDKNDEWPRSYDDPPNQNPLQATLEQLVSRWQPERESKVWALSNAERLLRERIKDGELDPPQSAHLSLNLAQLYEWIEREGLAPVPALAALRQQEHLLIRAALANREQIAEADLPTFDRTYARLALATASREGSPPELPEALRNHLTPEQRSGADAITRAIDLRRDPLAWAKLALRNEGDGAFLGAQRDEWRRTSRRDISAEFARRAGQVEPAEKALWRGRASAVLALGDGPPPELAGGGGLDVHLVRKLLGTGTGAWVAALVSALLAWIMGKWLARELRRRADLFTSFYAWDYERKIGPIGRPGRRRPD